MISEGFCRCVQAKDLALLRGVCVDLRHAASADELWEPLFRKDFGQPHGDVLRAGGWFLAYRQQALERAWARARRARLLAQFPFQPAGQYVGGGHPMFPVVGGDFDRLPQPFLGPGGGFGAFGGGATGPGGGRGGLFLGGPPFGTRTGTGLGRGSGRGSGTIGPHFLG